MCSVSQLVPPCGGEITACERNGRLVNIEDPSLLESYWEGQVTTFPSVVITPDSLRRTPSVAGESAKAAFLEHKESTMQRLASAWYDMGVTGVLTEICSEESSETVHPVLQKVCHYVMVGIRWLAGMHFTLFPHLKLSPEDLISEFCMNRDWANSPIRFLSWHPRAHKFAVALRDDTIKIYYTNKPIVPVLKHKLQKYITCMEWKPLSTTQLAVGTQTAILIWSIDPMSHSTRPSSGAIQVLTYGGHTPVTSIAWSPTGDDFLLATSAFNTAIVIWCTSMENYQVIQHITTCGGVSRVLWSKDGNKVLVATPSSSFRVFETGMWTNERWSNLSGRVQCACWNPRGSVLLFALAGDCHVYCVTFPDAQMDGPSLSGCSHATVALDLTPDNEDDSEDGESSVNDKNSDKNKVNCIHSMLWDETGQRVAVMFDKDDPRHHLIAIFSTSEDPVFKIAPKGYIQGKEDLEPVFMAFKPNFDMGACLTTCWSDGSMSYVPMYIPSVDSASNKLKFRSSVVHSNLNTTVTSRVGFERTGLWSTIGDESVFASRTTMQ